MFYDKPVQFVPQLSSVYEQLLFSLPVTGQLHAVIGEIQGIQAVENDGKQDDAAQKAKDTPRSALGRQTDQDTAHDGQDAERPYTLSHVGLTARIPDTIDMNSRVALQPIRPVRMPKAVPKSPISFGKCVPGRKPTAAEAAL